MNHEITRELATRAMAISSILNARELEADTLDKLKTSTTTAMFL